jgi:arsenate reductase
MDKSRVLFLCATNSCRSQLAEALVNARLADRWEAFSAGSNPAGYVHPLVTKALSEIGIEHTGQPKSIDEFRGQAFDLVVILCDQADDECPVWLGKGKIIERPFLNPATASGSEAEKMQVFREVRDGIAAEVSSLLSKQYLIGG